MKKITVVSSCFNEVENLEEFCRRVREVKDIPILMATVLGKGVDKIRGLGFGADDYIEKPFSPSVLVARADTACRRVTKTAWRCR